MTPVALALYPAVRGLLYLLLLGSVGLQAASQLLATSFATVPAVGANIATRLGWMQRRLPWLLLLVLLARGYCQLGSFVDPGDSLTADLVWGVLLTGTWGHAWLLQVAAASLWAVFASTRRNSATTNVSLVLLILIGQTGTGHAAAARWPTASGRLIDLLHLAGAGLWLGTLAVLLSVAIPRLLGADLRTPLARLVSSYSRYAQTGAALVVVSGLTAALVDGRTLGLAWHSRWGRLLLLKLIAMSGVIVLGWFNWRRVTPALNAERPAAAERLLWAVRVELLLGLIMLAITALLVVTPLPGEG
jgi:putative copper resistance protein D